MKAKRSRKDTNKRITFTISKSKLILATALILLVLVSFAVFGGKTNASKRIIDVPTTTVPTAVLPTTASSAKVQIVEFSDFQCPYCARVVPTIGQIKANYGGQVEIIFKHFPLDFHREAKKAGQASECARDQGNFWEYHDVLFSNQANLLVDDLKGYAAELGLDTTTFNSCLDSGEKAQIVERDFAEGQSRGVRGAPTFYINGQQFVGAQPYDKFVEIIDVMIEVNSGDDVVAEGSPELQEVQAQGAPAGGGSCGGACGSPTCGAATGGSCGCGG